MKNKETKDINKIQKVRLKEEKRYRKKEDNKYRRKEVNNTRNENTEACEEWRKEEMKEKRI
jgi:hypothetical protein